MNTNNYHREYYQKIVRNKEKVYCEKCDLYVLPCCYKAHLKSKRHIADPVDTEDRWTKLQKKHGLC